MGYSDGFTYSQLRTNLGSEISFPNVLATLAEMKPHSQTIHLHKISKAQIAAATKSQDFEQLAPMFGTIVHELTHWLDLVGTVWGQEYLLALYDSYESALHTKQEPEHQWWRVIQQYDQDRRIMFPIYYRYSLPDVVGHDINRPWSIDYSCGQEFTSNGYVDETRPIFFVKFGDRVSRETLARHPISIGTMLEISAVWCELNTQIQVLGQIQDLDRQKVSLTLFSRERAKTLYDQRLIEYTAPAHLLSVRAQTKEAMLTYHVGAALAQLCLNFLDCHFGMLKVPESFGPFGQARIDAFRTAQDRGFAFACIAFNAPEYDKSKSVDEWLTKALVASNLPSASEINSQALARLEALSKNLEMRWPLDETRNYLLEIGRCALETRAKLGTQPTLIDLMRSDIPLPSMFDEDGEIFNIGQKHLDTAKFDPEQMFQMEWALRKFSDNFMAGCRGTV